MHPTNSPGTEKAMQAIFRFLRGFFWMFALGLLPLQALLAQSAQAHEFVVAIRTIGTERDLILADALRGFLLATKERDGHSDETSNGHLGGLDVYIIPQTAEVVVQFPILKQAPSDRPDIIVVIGPSDAADAALEKAGKESPAMRPGALHRANLWSDTAPSDSAGFAARYNSAYQQPASKWAADGYNAARRIDDAVRLWGGVDDRAALERALATTAGGFRW
jgi:hypothetical protein